MFASLLEFDSRCLAGAVEHAAWNLEMRHGRDCAARLPAGLGTSRLNRFERRRAWRASLPLEELGRIPEFSVQVE